MRQAIGIPALTKSRFGKNQNYKVLTPDRRYVLLNLLNKLKKKDEMQSFVEYFIAFYNHFNKFNNTGTHILDSVSHMTIITTVITFIEIRLSDWSRTVI